jgi:GrpB-like predicted nucleotidyltransferase (UPF0157 family)
MQCILARARRNTDVSVDMIGLKNGKNLLVEYDREWPELFEQERTRLEAALQGTFKGIEHYGSTAVPGLPAKPILDILVGVLPLEDWTLCRAPLESLGYDYAEGAGVPGHFIFGRGRDRTERTHLVHVVEYGGEPWRSNLLFRDALRADAALREEYLNLKREAVATAPEGRSRYNELKHGFIAKMKSALSA